MTAVKANHHQPTGFLPVDPDVEAAIRSEGAKLFALMDAHPSPGILSRKGAYARLMEWSHEGSGLQDTALPVRRRAAVARFHRPTSSGTCANTWATSAVELHPALRTGLAAASFAPGLVAGPVQVADHGSRAPVRRRRDAGRPRAPASPKCADGIATTIDLLGETVVSSAEADAFLRRNLDVIDVVSAALARDPAPAFSDRGPGRPPAAPQSLRQDLGAHARGPPGRSGPQHRRAERAAAPHPPARARRRRVRQLRHGELPAQGPHAGPLPVDPRGGRIPRAAHGRDRPAGVPAGVRARPARARRLGSRGAAPDRRAPRQGRLLGARDHPGAPARVAGSGLGAQGGERRQLREAHLRAARRRRPRHAGARHAQCPLVRPRPRAGRPPGPRPARLRVPGAVRHGRRPQGRTGQKRAPGARVLRRRRAPARHGLPGAPPPGKHLERELPAPKEPGRMLRGTVAGEPGERSRADRAGEGRSVAAGLRPFRRRVRQRARHRLYARRRPGKPAGGAGALRAHRHRTKMAGRDRREAGCRPRVHRLDEPRASGPGRRVVGARHDRGRRCRGVGGDRGFPGVASHARRRPRPDPRTRRRSDGGAPVRVQRAADPGGGQAVDRGRWRRVRGD